ncbi:hypothetical protein CBNA_1097 [Coxiella burnetii str. Namibia]|nr:hypothetical protein CBNA_1097 [Coxiella burnetii str. Namibia]
MCKVPRQAAGSKFKISSSDGLFPFGEEEGIVEGMKGENLNASGHRHRWASQRRQIHII